jgi:hypothetical protein
VLELRGHYNIFELPQNGEAICITTNGIVKTDGHAVMGAGIAKQANDIFHLSARLGSYINQYGNRAFNLGTYQRCYLNNIATFTIFSLPTKYHYRDDSDITLICKSCEQLVEMCNKFGISKCYLTPPGCGCGNLNYENMVKPWISMILDDRFVVVDNRTFAKIC